MATAELGAPPLAPGDNLTREEFLRLWEMNPDIKKAELIGGIVYMASPVSKDHGVMDGYVGTWLGVYQVATPGTEMGHNTTSILLDDTPQPDDFLRILPEYGGASWTEATYLAGAPELFVEVCLSRAAYDLHQKFDLYESAGVQEYLAVLLHEKEIRWFALKKGKYQILKPGPNGIHRSRVYPGLWLNGKALFKGDMRRVLAKLQDGLDAPEHKAFVRLLAERKASPE
jgi:acyl-CoA synthetase (AMP-forming)/AMP-acid ligase II